MRRKVFAITALLALMACSIAYAASGPDHINASAVAKAKGSSRHPAVTSVTQKFTIKNAGKGYAWPATNINVKMAGLKTENAKYYPKCTASDINKAGSTKGWNKACKRGSLVATGKVYSTLYAADQPTAGGGLACDLGLDVYNAGQGKLTYFLTATGTMCADGQLQTGDAAPWTATYKNERGAMDMNVPLPPDVSTEAGGLPLWAAIDSETLTFKKIDAKIHGKRRPMTVSTGCKRNRRAYDFTFKIRDGSKTVKQTVKGSSKC